MTKTRRQYIEEIMGDLHAIRHRLTAKWLSKGNKPNITTSQWMVLGAIMREKTISVSGLAKKLGVTASAITQFVDDLVAKGCLVREDKVGDRRTLSLSVSPKYQKKICEMKVKHVDCFLHIFDALTDKELQEYTKLNKKIVENLKV